MKKKINK